MALANFYVKSKTQNFERFFGITKFAKALRERRLLLPDPLVRRAAHIISALTDLDRTANTNALNRSWLDQLVQHTMSWRPRTAVKSLTAELGEQAVPSSTGIRPSAREVLPPCLATPRKAGFTTVSGRFKQQPR